MTCISRLKSFTQKWHRDESGSVAVETVLMVPLLAWAMLATLTYFDAYRNEAINYKAGLTLADAISREQNDAINDDYVDGMYGLLQFLMLKDKTPDMRVSVFRYQLSDDKYEIVWSEGRGNKTALDTAGLQGQLGRLPVMTDQEVAILVETWSDYKAPYTVGLGEFDMATYNVISPRFTLQMCFDNSPGDGDDSSRLC